MKNLLGISAYYHDSAAALIRNGRIVAAAQEERFTRCKHDSVFPSQAVSYCLAEGGIGRGDLDAVVFYDKPIPKFTRILETYMSVAPRGIMSFLAAVPLWMRKKLWIPLQIEKSLERCGITMPDDLLFAEHHESHAASAFFPSPFRSAAILTVDGVGEWATSTIGKGIGNRVETVREMRFPHSLGLLYSAFTYFTGFRVNSGEYKLMGLAPYGEPRYADRIRGELMDLKDDGSFRLNMRYFGYLAGLRMTNARFCRLFDGPPREPESEITQREADLARSIQVVTEEIILRMARFARDTTGESNLCMAGGVALNCVANGKLVREGIFDDVWIQPAAGDAGGALGAALAAWHHAWGQPRHVEPNGRDSMDNALLGPEFHDDEIGEWLQARGYPARRLNQNERAEVIAGLIDEQAVVGLFQGRMEFGPRALGNRSIIGDPRSPTMQSVMNLKIKFRESFRPFAPACLQSHAGQVFDLDRPSPYMLVAAPVKESRRLRVEASGGDLMNRVHQVRSDLPAITHVDYSARVQTVSDQTNPDFAAIMAAFYERTGCPVVINTSFNVRGEPIVCTPEDAYRCFMRTEMDYLVLGRFLLAKDQQPPWSGPAGRGGGVALD